MVLRDLPAETASGNLPKAALTGRERSDPTVRAELKERHRRSADAARDFYARYPNHREAKTAHYLEALNALRGIPTDAPGRARALGIARDFRRDASQPAENRLKVAVLMDNLERGRPAGHLSNRAQSEAERERIIDGLHREFGERPEVYAMYVDLMSDLAPADSVRLANKILGLPAPESAKTEARATIARQRLIGKKAPLHLRDAAGAATNFATPSGRRTVLYFTKPEATFVRDERGAAIPTRWVHVVVGTSNTAPVAPPLGLQNSAQRYTLLAGLNSPECQALHVRELPYVVVLDAQGRVTAYGRGESLRSLIGE